MWQRGGSATRPLAARLQVMLRVIFITCFAATATAFLVTPRLPVRYMSSGLEARTGIHCRSQARGLRRPTGVQMAYGQEHIDTEMGEMSSMLLGISSILTRLGFALPCRICSC